MKRFRNRSLDSLNLLHEAIVELLPDHRWTGRLGAVVALACCLLFDLPIAGQAPAQTSARTRVNAKLVASSATLNKSAIAVTSLRLVQEKDGPAVEILSTKPLVPSIQALVDPPRIVIDLPNAQVEGQKKIIVQADQISALRANQFQQNPPVARVVVDLEAPRSYTWDAAGNRLVVHLGKNPSPVNAPVQAPTVPNLMPTSQSLVASLRAAGPLTVASSNGESGSVIAAGAETAIVNLSSGGEVRVCPGTTVSITPSANRHNMMLSMNGGALETHMALDASADAVLTPDFRIMLAGPGEFDFAISADNQGNTCVRALPGNTASAMVTELLGEGTYQVKATDQLVFRSGRLDHVDMAVPLECGCPPPQSPTLSADSSLPVANEVAKAAPGASLGVNPVNGNLGSGHTGAPLDSAQGQVAGLESPVGVSEAPNQLHVEVTAPLVFHADGPPPKQIEGVGVAADSGSISQSVGNAPVAVASSPTSGTQPTPAATAGQVRRRGFFKKVGAFFAGLFH